MLLKLIKREFAPVSILLFIAFFIAQPPYIWNKGILSGVVFGALICGSFICQKYKSFFLGISFFYFSLNTIGIWASYEGFPVWAQNRSAQAFGFMVLAVLPAVFFSKEIRYKVFNTLGLIAFVSSIIMVVRWPSSLGMYSFMNNAAMDASILAVLFPVLMLRECEWAGEEMLLNFACLIFLSVAIIFSGSSTALVAFVIMAVSFAFAEKKTGITFSVLLLAVIPSVLYAFFLGHKFIENSGRFFVWKHSMIYFKDKVNLLIGSGGGTYLDLGNLLQQRAGHNKPGSPIFIFMHNEYLQVLFEQGFIGLFLMVGVGFLALKKAYKKPWLFSSLCTYAFIMLTQFPFRFYPSSFIGAMLLVEAFSNEEKN